MLTETATVPAATLAILLLSTEEAFQFDAFRDALPQGWAVELKADVGMAWVTYVYYADAPRDRPVFTICRWSGRVGLFVQWTDGSIASAAAFTELQPVIDLISNDIFAYTEAHLATVQSDGWARTAH